MKFFLIAVLNLTMNVVCYAQKDKITITLNPFSFLEPQAGFTPGVGYHFNKRWAVYSDVGVIFFEGFPNDRNNSQSILGYKIKPALRYNFKEKPRPISLVEKAGLIKRKHRRGRVNFFEIEGLLKKTDISVNSPVNIFDNTGNLVFSYLAGYNILRTVYGASIKFGTRTYFNKNKRMGADFFMGVGIRSGFQKIRAYLWALILMQMEYDPMLSGIDSFPTVNRLHFLLE
jgi:hypothetical protein